MRARFVGQPFADNLNLLDFVADALSEPSAQALSAVVAWAKRSGLGRVREALMGFRERYERKLWMRDLVMGVAYPPVDR